MIESDISFHIGKLFMNEDNIEAEKHLRASFQADPGNQEKMGALAWTLICNALKINEGMDLMEKALEADPLNATLLHCQGCGYYIQGNYQEALTNLYIARDLYQQFNFDVNSHIKMAEEALASLDR